MLKTRRNSPLLPCAALATVLCLGIAGRAVADQAIVVAATAPGLTIGQVIEDGGAVRMPEGSNALFLFSSGRTVTVKGPYEGPLDRLSGGKEPQNRLTGLFGAERFAQNELGAARNVGPPKGRAAAGELPAIDASLPGVWCVLEVPRLRAAPSSFWAKRSAANRPLRRPWVSLPPDRRSSDPS